MMYAKILLPIALVCMGIAPSARGDESRFDVAVADAPARTFFEGLADGTPYNIVLEPGVGGSITLKLKNVTLIEVLDAAETLTRGPYPQRSGIASLLFFEPSLRTLLPSAESGLDELNE